MSTTTTPHAIESATWRVPEAAALAGISERTLWRWLDAKRVPGVLKVGKCVRIHKKLFAQFLETGLKN